MWVEFVVGSRPCFERFFLRGAVFPLHSKTSIFIFQFYLLMYQYDLLRGHFGRREVGRKVEVNRLYGLLGRRNGGWPDFFGLFQQSNHIWSQRWFTLSGDSTKSMYSLCRGCLIDFHGKQCNNSFIVIFSIFSIVRITFIFV